MLRQRSGYFARLRDGKGPKRCLQSSDRPLARQAQHQHPHALRRSGPPTRDRADLGNIADLTAAAKQVSAKIPPGEPVGDKGCYANHLRHFLTELGTVAVTQSIRFRKVDAPHDTDRSRLRNVLERTSCPIMGFHGIAPARTRQPATSSPPSASPQSSSPGLHNESRA